MAKGGHGVAFSSRSPMYDGEIRRDPTLRLTPPSQPSTENLCILST
jgi:hypothetical protein